MATSFLRFTAENAGLNKSVRDLRGRFREGNQAMLRVNQRSIADLKAASAKILDEKATRREKDPRNRKGLSVVEQDDAHEATIDRFGFWVLDRIAGIDERVLSYYRAIDQGSDYWVEQSAAGRYVALIFYPGVPTKPTREVSTQAAYADPRGARVLITNPVPAYEFLSRPVEDFRTSGRFAQYVQEEFARVGLKPVITAVP